MARPTRHRRLRDAAETARRWERWQFLTTVAIRLVATILEPLLDRWYGGPGNGRLL